MKNLLSNIFKTILFLAIVLLALTNKNLYAQISEGGVPPSMIKMKGAKMNASDLQIPKHKVRSVNIDSVRKKIEEIRKECTNCKKQYYGVGVDVMVDLIKDGKKETLDDGSITRYTFYADKAEGLQFYFSKFKIPSGSKLFIYNSNFSKILGAYTSNNNKDGGKFAIQPIQGDTITLEYYQPFTVVEEPELEIFKVINVFEKSLFGGDADGCIKDVTCSEGIGWDKEIRTVGLVLYYDKNYDLTAWCSGFLINNTQNDGRPYFMSANHCISSESGDTYGFKKYDYFHWVIMFNYQNTTCGGGNPNIYNTISGANLLSTANQLDYSDFALFELHETPPASYNACYAGWDNRSDNEVTIPTSVVGIHHPAGDVKKISISSNASLSPYTYYNKPDAYWSLTWTDGVTAGGSSGSPLFDENHRVIGQLYGGYSGCTDNGTTGPTYHDYYGRFTMSYTDGSFWIYLDPYNTDARYVDTYCPVYPTACQNGMLDAGETGIDCGGTCPPCVPTCSDNIKNQGEVGIDCGGPCPACPPTCNDYIQNQGETGVDCGGPCPACPTPTCSDHIKNQTETGIDCGGPCQPCAAFCNDQILNGDELEVDCGGSCGPCLDYLTNGSFEDKSCTFPLKTDYSGTPFNQAPYCIEGPWYASHGAPAIKVWSDNTESLRFYSGPLEDYVNYVYYVYSDGIFYQFPTELDPGKIYTLHFKYKDYIGYGYTPMNFVEFYAANGLVPMDHEASTPSDYFLPSYSFNKVKIGEYGAPSGADPQTTFWSTKFDFTVPGYGYDQLWITGYNYNAQDYTTYSFYYMDDFVLTAVPKECVAEIDYTNTSSMPDLTEAFVITTGDNVQVLSGQKKRFKAVNSVTFNPGFLADANSAFLANIDYCDVNSYPTFKMGLVNDSIPKPSNIHVDRKLEPSSIDSDNRSIAVVPNPSSENFKIQLFGSYDKAEIKVLDLYGKLIREVAKGSFMDKELELNMRGESPGVYMLIVKFDSGQKIVKLILE